MSLFKISVNPQRGRQKVEETLKKGAQYAFETTQIRGDGTPMYLSVNASVIEYRGHLAIMSINRDVTEMKHAQQQLRQQDELRSLQRIETVSQIAAGVAHDFNNVLTIIKGCSAILDTEVVSNAPYRQEVDHIREAAQMGTNLAQQLTALGRSHLRPSERLDLNKTLTGLKPLLHRMAGEHIDLQISLDHNLEPIGLEAMHVERILVNLLVNAKDAMRGSGIIHITTQVANLSAPLESKPPIPPGRYALLTVSDSGPGIEEETLPYIFEPYYTTKGDRGTGLGLATIYRFVTQAHGHIRVHSRLGEGAAFSLYLPVSLAQSPLSTAIQRADSSPRLIATRIDAEKLRRMLDAVDDAIYVISVDEGRFVEVSAAACRMLGFSRKELLSMGPGDLIEGGIKTSSQVWEEQVKRLRISTCLSLLTTHRHHDGRKVIVDVHLTLLELENVSYVVAVSRDMTRPTPSALA